MKTSKKLSIFGGAIAAIVAAYFIFRAIRDLRTTIADRGGLRAIITGFFSFGNEDEDFDCADGEMAEELDELPKRKFKEAGIYEPADGGMKRGGTLSLVGSFKGRSTLGDMRSDDGEMETVAAAAG